MKFDKGQLLIYAVTDRAWTGKMSLYEQTEAALKGGATMVQLREKGLRDDNVEEYLEEAKKMRALTEKYNVPLLIDDNIKLAKACGADGVHVGQNDMDAGLARQLLGPDKILGVTAKTVEQALKAQSQGADYLGSGAVFGTSTKKDARPMTMEQLQAGIANTRWQGRMETILPGVIVDGAHNEDGVRRFVETAERFQKEYPLTLLFSAVNDKDYQDMIHTICSRIKFRKVVTTEVGGYREVPSAELAEIFCKEGCKEVGNSDNIEEAFHMAHEAKGEDGMLFCVGSLYLVGEIKTLLLKK